MKLCAIIPPVPRVGIEPTRLAAADFKSTMSTNSITRAFYFSGKLFKLAKSPSINFAMRPRAESNRRVRVLQTLALPLGD
jgi:hypothetical protein